MEENEMMEHLHITCIIVSSFKHIYKDFAGGKGKKEKGLLFATNIVLELRSTS